jgi:hypothetical protein
MSFNTIVTISAVTEVVVILGIVLTLLNAFSEGKLVAFAAGIRHGRPSAVSAPRLATAVATPDEEWALKHAA